MNPPTRTDETTERIHGVEIRDPYRWLEEERSPEVRSWVEAQNDHTRSILEPWPGREALRRRLKALLSTGTLGSPVVEGGRVFYTRREGTQDQPVLLVREAGSEEDRLLVDPNTLAPDGTTALDWWYPSRDGSLLAYGISDGGSELSLLRVRDVATGRDLPDRIPRTRACSLAWEPNGKAFFYTRYPEPGSVPREQEMYHRRVFHHRLGTDPATDRPVFGEGRPHDGWPNVALAPGGRWLVVTEAEGWVRTRVYLMDLRAGSSWIPLVEDRDALYGVLPLDDRLIIHTNEDAPGYRVLAADPADPGRSRWKELIPEGEDVLQIADVAGGKIFAAFLKNAASVLRVFSLDGEFEGEVPVPPTGTIYGFDGEIAGDEIYLGYISFTVAPRIYRYRIPERELSLWQEVSSPVPEGKYETVQVHCASRDGTRVPMFIIHRKGISLDGTHPALLTGYGGFSVSLTPSFDRESFLWLENGGVLAVANLRGGGEFGEAWHRSGTLERKQNVFDDFIAAAEHLCREGYTEADRLAIKGGSNGGLLVGAALTQRPDLFRAVVCRVPLLDMIRYQHFRIARLWIPEYGSSEDAAHLRWLLDYSPYHNVRESVRYPSVLLTTAESDSRVDPMHARKMAARLQAAQAAEDRPILLRVETRAGHGAGKPLSKQLEEQLDIWTFLFREMGMEPADPSL